MGRAKRLFPRSIKSMRSGKSVDGLNRAAGDQLEKAGRCRLHVAPSFQTETAGRLSIASPTCWERDLSHIGRSQCRGKIASGRPESRNGIDVPASVCCSVSKLRVGLLIGSRLGLKSLARAGRSRSSPITKRIDLVGHPPHRPDVHGAVIRLVAWRTLDRFGDRVLAHKLFPDTKGADAPAGEGMAQPAFRSPLFRARPTTPARKLIVDLLI